MTLKQVAISGLVLVILILGLGAREVNMFSPSLTVTGDQNTVIWGDDNNIIPEPVQQDDTYQHRFQAATMFGALMLLAFVGLFLIFASWNNDNRETSTHFG